MKQERAAISKAAEPRAIREHVYDRKGVGKRIMMTLGFFVIGAMIWFLAFWFFFGQPNGVSPRSDNEFTQIGYYLKSLRDSARQEDIGLATGAIAFTGLTIIINQAMKVVEKGGISLPRHRDQTECNACETSTEGRMATRQYTILFFAQTLAAVVSIFALGCTYLAFAAGTDVAGFAYLIMGSVLLFFLWDSTSLEFQFGVSAGEFKREWDAQKTRWTRIQALFEDAERTKTGRSGKHTPEDLETRRDEIARSYLSSRRYTWLPLGIGTLFLMIMFVLIAWRALPNTEFVGLFGVTLASSIAAAALAPVVSPVRVPSDWLFPVTILFLSFLMDVVVVVYVYLNPISTVRMWWVVAVLVVSFVLSSGYLRAVLARSSRLTPETWKLYLSLRQSRNIKGKDKLDSMRSKGAATSDSGFVNEAWPTRVKLAKDEASSGFESVRVVCSYWDEASATRLFLKVPSKSSGKKSEGEWEAVPFSDSHSPLDEFGIELMGGEYEFVNRFVSPGTKVWFQLEPGYSWEDSCWTVGESSLEHDGSLTLSCKETIALGGSRTQLRLKVTTNPTAERLDQLTRQWKRRCERVREWLGDGTPS